MSFGKRLKKLRIEQHLSQSEFAAKLGLSTNAVSQYETDKRFPSQQCIVKICKTFNISSDYLFGLSDFTYQQNDLRKLFLDNKYSEEQIAVIINLLEIFNNKKDK